MEGLVRLPCPRCSVREEAGSPAAGGLGTCRSCGHAWTWPEGQVEAFWQARVGLRFRIKVGSMKGHVAVLTHVHPRGLLLHLLEHLAPGEMPTEITAIPERFDLEWEEIRQPTPDDLRLLEMTVAGILPAPTPELQRQVAAAKASMDASAREVPEDATPISCCICGAPCPTAFGATVVMRIYDDYPHESRHFPAQQIVTCELEACKQALLWKMVAIDKEGRERAMAR